MAISSWSAGIIRPVAVAPTGPYQDGAAPGVWTLDEAAFWTKQGLWPTAGNLAPSALFGGGSYSDRSNVIQYISIASTGNAQDFGDLAIPTETVSGCASTTRGIFAGGEATGIPYVNVISYVTISTKSNATDFGDLTVGRRAAGGCNSSTRGVFAAGLVSGPAYSNIIDYITIATIGNAIDFGDLTVARYYLAGCSSGNGGNS